MEENCTPTAPHHLPFLSPPAFHLHWWLMGVWEAKCQVSLTNLLHKEWCAHIINRSTLKERKVKYLSDRDDSDTYKTGKKWPPEWKSAYMILLIPYLSLIQPAACSICWQRRYNCHNHITSLAACKETAICDRFPNLKGYSRAVASVIISQRGGEKLSDFYTAFQ